MFVLVMMAVAMGVLVLVFVVMRMPADSHLADTQSASAIFAHKFFLQVATVSPCSEFRLQAVGSRVNAELQTIRGSYI